MNVWPGCLRERESEEGGRGGKQVDRALSREFEYTKGNLIVTMAGACEGSKSEESLLGFRQTVEGRSGAERLFSDRAKPRAGGGQSKLPAKVEDGV